MKRVVSISIAISDISVSAALVIKESSKREGLDDARPLIKTYRTKSFNPEHGDMTYDYLEGRLKTLLHGIVKDTRYKDVEKAGLNIRNISRATVSLAAPWFEGKTIMSHFEQEKEFKVTENILDKTFDNEIKSISGADKNEITILETDILGSTLNGYTIQQPLGKMATSLSILGYVSFTRKSLRVMIEEIIDSFFPHVSEVLIKTEPTILLKAALREVDIMNVKNNFAIIRVNEIMTHIQVIRNGHLKELGTVPIGLNTILRDLAEKCKVTYDVASQLLKLYFDKNLEQANLNMIEPVINETLERWRQGIRQFSSSTILSGSFPSHVFLSSPSIISHILKDYLMKDNYLDLTMSEKSLAIDILDRSTLNNFVDIDENVDGEPGFLTKLNAMV